MELVSLKGKEEAPEDWLSPPKGDKNAAICKEKEGPHQKPNMPGT